jgi:hypothetical protein
MSPPSDLVEVRAKFNLLDLWIGALLRLFRNHQNLDLFDPLFWVLVRRFLLASRYRATSPENCSSVIIGILRSLAASSFLVLFRAPKISA